jgi:OOP family OmpA-OmpF porin
VPERGAPAPASQPTPDEPEREGSAPQLAEVRELLFGAERRQIEELRRRLDTIELSPEELAEQLPRAVAMRSARDRELAVALAPTVERAIGESVRRNPRDIATAIFPVLGPAIRTAIAEAMADLVHAVNRSVAHSVSLRGLRWRLEAWRTGVPFAQVVIKHTLVYRVEQVFLVHAETGLLLAHVPDQSGDEANLVSGMLTAIRDFVTDSFQSTDTGELRTFSAGDVCVLAEPGPQGYVAAVVRGTYRPALVTKLQETVETIHVRWYAALAAFDGDPAPFEGTRPLLEECLETVLADDERGGRGRRRMARFAWLLPVAILLLAIGVPLLRARQRWRSAVAAVEAEPGIVLVRSERHWGRWSFSGLRDPLARDPAAVLAALGVDTASVDERWEPFVSTEPPLTLARARRALAPSPTVSLRLAGDTLVAEGTASVSWIARAAMIGPALPGIAFVALGAVSSNLPAELETLQRDAVSRHVLFATGSAELDSAARAETAAFAATYDRLRREAASRGFDLALVLTGRTDATGAEATNRDLSQRRVDAVRSALGPLGVASIAGVEALSSSKPLPAGSAADRARLNRSVSFSIEARLTRGGQ